MRSSWTVVLRLWPVFSFAATFAQSWTSGHAEVARDVTVLEHSPSTAYTKFAVQCPGCFNRDSADDSLVFDLQVNPADDPRRPNVVVNHVTLPIVWEGNNRVAESSQVIRIPDSTGYIHTFSLSWSGVFDDHLFGLFWENDDVIQSVQFQATSTERFHDGVPASAGFIVAMRPTGQDRLLGLMSESRSQIIDFERLEQDSIPGSPPPPYGGYDSDASSEADSFDLDAELESLRLLENKAHDIQVQITAKKKAIAANLKHEHDKQCLKDLIQECDGIICCAKAIAQRLCDKVGIATGHSFDYAQIKTQHKQAMASSDAKMSSHEPNFSDCPKGMRYCKQSANLPLMLTKNASEYTFNPIDLVNPPNPLVRALEIIGAVLGLTGLFVFLRRKCMSMRRRVERAADLEERRNARAYKRAARRALMRKRWENFCNAVNCFGRKEEPRIDDYEEKRALILQDAFLEQDLDQAEKGEIMEAEIRELRYAHEIVSSLVRVGEHRYDLITPVNDPPPPLVPLPQTPGPRSRASTYTLPSYTSESLPDYTSHVSDSDSSSSLVNGYTPPTSDEQGRCCSPPPASEISSARTRYTPTSSVLETSPRPSQETIRTRPSQCSRD